MKYFLNLFVAAAFASAGPLWADAGVSQRLESLSRSIAQDPTSQMLHLRRALAYVNDNQSEKALADIKTAETLGDPVVVAYTHGVLLYGRGEYAAALPYFDRYLQTYPYDRNSLSYRARLLRNIGESARALADYEALIRQDDALDPGYYVAAARLLSSLPERGVDEALRLLDQRMVQRGPLSSLQRYAVELERQRGDYQAAIRRMALLDERLRATPQWQLDVAQLLLFDERPVEAQSYLALAQEQLASARATAVNSQLQQRASRLQEQAVLPVQEEGASL